MSPISTRICVPNLVAVGWSCKKKGGGVQTDKGKRQLYSRLAGYPASLGRKGGRGREERGREGVEEGGGGEGWELREGGEEGGKEGEGERGMKKGRGREGGREGEEGEGGREGEGGEGGRGAKRSSGSLPPALPLRSGPSLFTRAPSLPP